MTGLRALVSGGGIAGLTAAWWLAERGNHPIVVERRHDLHDQGYMIDFYGSGFDVAERMGLREALAGRHYDIPTLDLVDGHGRKRSELDITRFRAMLGFRHYNFMRGDLESELHDAVRMRMPVRFDTSITAIAESGDGVIVRLSDGSTEEVDLVIGADGFRSNVRALVWGPSRQFERFLGLTVACSIIANDLDLHRVFLAHFVPGVQTALYTIRSGEIATLFAFRSPPLQAESRDAQMDALLRYVGGSGWLAPRLLAATRGAGSFFFDAVSQIEVPTWHRGRVVLVGDSCACMTLLAGQGASMAMAGAWHLAHAIAAARTVEEGLDAYEAVLKPEITRRQKTARSTAGSFVPRTRLGVGLTQLFLKYAFLPGLRSLFRSQIGAESIIPVAEDQGI